MATAYNNLSEILKAISGDRVDQEDLFNLQDRVCQMLLEEAVRTNKQQKLVKDFPYYFVTEEVER